MLQAASRVEEEIRAYPRLHSAFYAAVTRSSRVRDLVGRVKDQVRADEAPLPDAPLVEDDDVLARRRAAVRARILPSGGEGP